MKKLKNLIKYKKMEENKINNVEGKGCQSCPHAGTGACPNCPFTKFMDKPKHNLEELYEFENKIKKRLAMIQEEIEKQKRAESL